MLQSEVRKYSCGSREIFTAPAMLCKAGPCIWRLGDYEHRKAAMQARRGRQGAELGTLDSCWVTVSSSAGRPEA